MRARAKIAARIIRLQAGSFGDCKPLRDGVWELRVDWGPGYRIYYAMAGRSCVLLLCGGDKRKQTRDIERESLYRVLSSRGNPRLSTLMAVLKALGLTLSLEPAGSMGP